MWCLLLIAIVFSSFRRQSLQVCAPRCRLRHWDSCAVQRENKEVLLAALLSPLLCCPAA
jgi:hypothetical protein